MQLQPSKSWQESYLGLTLITLLLISLLVAGCGDNTPTPTVPPADPTATPTLATSPTSAATNPAATATSATGTTAANGTTSAVTFSTPSSSETPPPGAVRGADGRFYYIVDPILPFYKANGWLGLPLGGMREARPNGYDWDGVYQNFQRGRVEAHRDKEGKYSVELGLVNQELLKLKGQGR